MRNDEGTLREQSQQVPTGTSTAISAPTQRTVAMEYPTWKK